jgi:hypothetical protein
MEKIGILGSGGWSKKVASSLASHHQVVEYSSRAFKSQTQFIDASHPLVWITSKNSEQLELANLLLQSNFEGKIILEKPYFTTAREKAILINLIESSQNRIFLSQVWAKSRIWKEYLRIILSSGYKFQISALRVGEKRRSEFLPPLDWLPHDLYLAADLARNLDQEIKVVASGWQSDNDIIIGSVLIGTLSKLNLRVGYSTERSNSWKTISENGDCMELDFVGRSIKFNESIIFQESEQSVPDFPILNFANWVLTQSSDLEQLRLIDLNSRFLLENKLI